MKKLIFPLALIVGYVLVMGNYYLNIKRFRQKANFPVGLLNAFLLKKHRKV